MTQVQPGSGPTALRILLGSQLRRLREAKGLTREEAGHLIRGSESKISRMELGRVGLRERDVADLLTFYGVEDEAARSAVMDLLLRANEPGWWHRFNDLLPSWFQTYVGLEEGASRIRTYEVQFVPGLLQTEDYARAVITAGSAGIAPRRSPAASTCGWSASRCSIGPTDRSSGRSSTRRHYGVPSAAPRSCRPNWST